MEEPNIKEEPNDDEEYLEEPQTEFINLDENKLKFKEEIMESEEVILEELKDKLVIKEDPLATEENTSMNGDSNEEHLPKEICDTCGLTFNTEEDLLKHEAKHVSLNLKCNFCDYLAKTAGELTQHKRDSHADKRTKICKYCGKGFFNARNLNMHKRLHGNYGFVCESCGKSFALKIQLLKHQVIHTGEKPYHCKDCGQKFAKRTMLKNHVTRKHPDNNSYNFSSFVCEVCNAKFSRRDRLRDHSRRHTNERPYECNMCGRRFIAASSLRSHKIRHHQIKDLSCKFCDFTTAVSRELTNHRKEKHADKQTFFCAECGKGFFNNFKLKLHMNSHMEKSFPCATCGKFFSSKYTLIKHSKTVHKDVEQDMVEEKITITEFAIDNLDIPENEKSLQTEK